MRIILASALLAVTSTAGAARLGGVTMPSTSRVDGKTLVLNGMGIREATIFGVDVYVAGLYLEHESKDGAAIIAAEAAKRIVMHFVRDVDRDDLVRAWKKGFGGAAALTARVKQLNGYMTDVGDGDGMTFTYIPGRGTEVVVKGKAKGVIAGADFAAALFRIWLGPHPPNEGLRRGMLGG